MIYNIILNITVLGENLVMNK